MGATSWVQRAVLPVPGPPTSRAPQVLAAGRCSRQAQSLAQAHSRHRKRRPGTPLSAAMAAASAGRAQGARGTQGLPSGGSLILPLGQFQVKSITATITTPGTLDSRESVASPVEERERQTLRMMIIIEELQRPQQHHHQQHSRCC